MATAYDSAHIPAFDGWRGLAIACLLVGHFFPVAGFNFGSIGVSLFFALSGLLMTRILFVQKLPLKQFYQRRIARIFPSVYVFLLIVCAAFSASALPISLFELGTAATFTNNYLKPAAPWTMPFGHIWSLSVEEHTYILLSALALLTRKHLASSLPALAVATAITVPCACAYGLLAALGKAELGDWLSHSEVAAYGILIASLLYLGGAARQVQRSDAVAVVLFLILGVLVHYWRVPAPLRLLIGGAAFALALCRLPHAPRALLACFTWAPLRYLGLWSFSLYMWQQPFYQLVPRQGWHPALGLALSFACGILAFYTVEQPARRYLNRRWGAPQATSSTDKRLPTSLP